MRAQRLGRVATALAAAGILAAGCSGGGDTGTAGTPAAAPEPTSAPAAAATTTAAGSAVAPAPATRPAEEDTGNPERCTSGELSVSLGDSDAGAGSVYASLILTNTGRRTCELRGFPGVSYVAGDDGHQVGPAAAMSGERGGRVPIAPNGTLVAKLQMVNVRNFDAAACRPTPVRGLRVYPPGDTASLFVAMEGTGCSITPPGDQLSVQTITPS